MLSNMILLTTAIFSLVLPTSLKNQVVGATKFTLKQMKESL